MCLICVDFENKNSISLNLMFKGKRGSRLLRDDKFRLPSQLCTKRKKKFKRLFSKRGHSDININYYLEWSRFGRNFSWLILELTVEARSLSQAEKKYCSCKLSKFIIFTQNGHGLKFCEKNCHLLSCSACNNSIFFLTLR